MSTSLSTRSNFWVDLTTEKMACLCIREWSCVYTMIQRPSTPALAVAPPGAKPWHSQPHSLPLIKTTGHFALFFRLSPSHDLSGKNIMCIKSTCINSPPVGWAKTPQERHRFEPQLYRADTHSDDLQASLPFLNLSVFLSLCVRLGGGGMLIVLPDLKCLRQSCWVASWFRGSRFSGSWGCAKQERWGRIWDVSPWTAEGEETLQTDDSVDRTYVND